MLTGLWPGEPGLSNLKELAAAGWRAAQFLARPPGTGFSLAQLQALAEPFDLHLTPIKLNPTAPLPVPCVAHLAIDHYVAVLEERDGFCLTADPALGRRRWLRAEVLWPRAAATRSSPPRGPPTSEGR